MITGMLAGALAGALGALLAELVGMRLKWAANVRHAISVAVFAVAFPLARSQIARFTAPDPIAELRRMPLYSALAQADPEFRRALDSLSASMKSGPDTWEAGFAATFEFGRRFVRPRFASYINQASDSALLEYAAAMKEMILAVRSDETSCAAVSRGDFHQLPRSVVEQFSDRIVRAIGGLVASAKPTAPVDSSRVDAAMEAFVEAVGTSAPQGTLEAFAAAGEGETLTLSQECAVGIAVLTVWSELPPDASAVVLRTLLAGTP